jgi:hypothetical protein
MMPKTFSSKEYKCLALRTEISWILSKRVSFQYTRFVRVRDFRIPSCIALQEDLEFLPLFPAFWGRKKQGRDSHPPPLVPSS